MHLRNAAGREEVDDRHSGLRQRVQRQNTSSTICTESSDGSRIASKEKDEIEKTRMGVIFPDAAQMKERVRKALMKKTYNVQDFYKDEGYSQKIARSNAFEHMTLLIITTNALWIWYDTDTNESESLLDARTVYVSMENFFCAYFTLELVIRFVSFKWKRNCVRDAWFVFDSLLVLSAIFETWVMTIIVSITKTPGGGLGNASILRLLRLARLTRMARMARLLRAMPELMILIKGMAAATRSVLLTLSLMTVILYVFAIAFTQLAAKTALGENYFANIPLSMRNLLTYGTFYDNIGVIWQDLANEGAVYWILFLAYILLASLTVMNMLIGVLCEVVSAVAATENEQMTVLFVKSKMQELVQQSGIDEDNDGEISKTEFVKILENVEATRTLAEVGVDPVGLVDFADFIFEDDSLDDGERRHERRLSFEDFMGVILELRGSNNATVKDIVDLRKFIRTTAMQTNARLARLEANCMPKASSTRRSSRTSESHAHAHTKKEPEDGDQKSAAPGPSKQAWLPGAPPDAPQPLQMPSLASSEHARAPAALPGEVPGPLLTEEVRAWVAACEWEVLAWRTGLERLLQGPTGAAAPGPGWPLRLEEPSARGRDVDLAFRAAVQECRTDASDAGTALVRAPGVPAQRADEPEVDWGCGGARRQVGHVHELLELMMRDVQVLRERLG